VSKEVVSEMRETWQLIKFILRRERVSLAIWIVGIVSFLVYLPFLYEDLYPTLVDRYAAMTMMSNPAIVAIVGPSTGVYTLAAIFTQEALLFTLIGLAIMNILLVNRHTRVDEEFGRLELIRSFPVSSTAVLTAVFVVAFFANLIIGATVAMGLAMSGVYSVTVAGSVLFGVILTVTGLFFAAITAVGAQLFSTAKGSSGFAFVAMLVMYLLRAVGDMARNFLSYLSPLGLMLQAQPFVADNWWAVIIVIVLTVVLGGLAFYLVSNRDLGQGLIPAKAGPREAKPALLSTGGLAWRLQRGSLIAWFVGSFIIGMAYGAVIGEVETFIGDNEMIQMILAMSGESDASMIYQFIPFLVAFLVIVLLIPMLAPLLRLAGEEKRNLSEHLLARVVSRGGLLKSYFVISIVASITLLFAAGLGFWLTGTAFLDNPIAFGTLMGVMMAHLPAAWILIGITTVLVGWLPKFASSANLLIAFMFFIAFFGVMLNLPQVILNLSPLTHIPSMPIAEFSLTSFLVMIVIAACLLIIGFVGYHKRDVTG